MSDFLCLQVTLFSHLLRFSLGFSSYGQNSGNIKRNVTCAKDESEKRQETRQMVQAYTYREKRRGVCWKKDAEVGTNATKEGSWPRLRLLNLDLVALKQNVVATFLLTLALGIISREMLEERKGVSGKVVHESTLLAYLGLRSHIQ